MKIETSFEYPPIPIRDFDWSAIDAETYDIEGKSCIVGRGRTEAEAIADLIEKLEEARS